VKWVTRHYVIVKSQQRKESDSRHPAPLCLLVAWRAMQPCCYEEAISVIHCFLKNELFNSSAPSLSRVSDNPWYLKWYGTNRVSVICTVEFSSFTENPNPISYTLFCLHLLRKSHA